MQSYKFDEVINRACEKKQLDKELMKNISNFVFTETKKEMGKFSNLRIFLEGLIIFFYGKTRLEIFKERITDETKKPLYFMASKTLEEIEEVKNKVDVLLNTYEIYIKEKKEIKTAYRERKLKNATEDKKLV